MRSALLSAAAALPLLASAAPAVNPGEIVSTSSGKFSPYFNPNFSQVAQFLNIPYAQPPVGSLRYAPPAAVKYNSSVTMATSTAPACLQRYSSASYNDNALYKISVTQFGSHTSEDCLRLAVYMPSRVVQPQKLPVVIFFYGGAFELGGYATPAYDPSAWVNRTQSHIVVEFNYRVGLLGFPNSAGLAAAGQNVNLGLLDQRAALAWVYKNIAQFGGDPTQITLWGESAGATSVDYLNFAYPTKPLARAVILDSGTAIPALTPGDTSNFTYAAAHLGCANLSPASELACMRNVSQNSLRTWVESSNNRPHSLNWNPIADGVTAFSDYTSLLQAGNFSKLPTLAGTNAREGFGIIPYVAAPTLTASETALGNSITRVAFQCPLLASTALKQAAGVSTHQYYYAGNFSNVSPEPWLGAYHTSELPLIFGTLGWTASAAAAASSGEVALSNHMQDLWLAFIKDPVNGLNSTGWPVASSGKGLELGLKGALQNTFSISVLVDECKRNAPA